MPLLNVQSYVFINVFYLVLFCIHVYVDAVTEKKTDPLVVLTFIPAVSSIHNDSISTIGVSCLGSLEQFVNGIILCNL